MAVWPLLRKAYQQNKDKTTAVENIQKSLNTLGYKYGDEGELKVDGDFGVKTQTNWDNFISDLGVDNYLSGIASNVKNLYSNIYSNGTNLVNIFNNKNNINTEPLQLYRTSSAKFAQATSNNAENFVKYCNTEQGEKEAVSIAVSSIKDILCETEIPEGYIQGTTGIEPDYRPYDAFKSWQSAINLWSPLMSTNQKQELQDAMSNVNGVVAFEVSGSAFVKNIGGQISLGIIIDQNGDYAIYSGSGAGVGGAGIGATLAGVYYNADDIYTVLEGSNSSTHGGMLGILGFNNTLFENNNVNYSGISVPIGIGLGMYGILNSDSTIYKEGNIFDD